MDGTSSVVAMAETTVGDNDAAKYDLAAVAGPSPDIPQRIRQLLHQPGGGSAPMEHSA